MRYVFKNQTFEVLKVGKEAKEQKDGTKAFDVLLEWEQTENGALIKARIDASKKLERGKKITGTITIGISAKSGNPYEIIEFENAQ